MAKKTAMKGRYLMLMVGSEAIALSTSCSLNRSLSMIDPETKDDSIYKKVDPDSEEWSIDFEAQLDANQDLITQLNGYFDSKEKKNLIFGKAANAADTDVPESDWTSPATVSGSMTGQGILTSLKVDGPVNGKATVSGTWTGAGPLTTEE